MGTNLANGVVIEINSIFLWLFGLGCKLQTGYNSRYKHS